jgi:NAD(P)-dependent dehydrogenase (short-subunit alcohol dehydrogenase family)
MQVSLTGKTAIVTGAASGIGLAIVRQYLDSEIEGVVAVDVAARPSDSVFQPGNGRLAYVEGDVALEATAQEFARVAIERFGRIDILVNNAGVALAKPLHEHTPEQWDRVMNTNAKAIYWAARQVIPVMIQQRSGVILNTGSISGQVGIAGQGAYAPSKGALHMLTRQMAVEYAKYGIRVNAIGCGTVETPLVHQSAEETGDPAAFWNMLRSNHPIGRIASPEEIAGFFTYMASDLASFFTGSILMMDGGFTAK